MLFSAFHQLCTLWDWLSEEEVAVEQEGILIALLFLFPGKTIPPWFRPRSLGNVGDEESSPSLWNSGEAGEEEWASGDATEQAINHHKLSRFLLALFWALIGNVCSFIESVFLTRKERRFQQSLRDAEKDVITFQTIAILHCFSFQSLPHMVCQLQGQSSHTGLPSLETTKQGRKQILLGCQTCGTLFYLLLIKRNLYFFPILNAC